MNFLICSKLSIPDKDRTLPAWEHLRTLGHTVIVEHPKDCSVPPDAIISMGVTIMEETFEAIEKYPTVPLFCYNWDCYEWVWTNPRDGEYDYRRYGELLGHAKEIWVPSHCTGVRTKQWWGHENWHVILSACPWWDHPNVHDGGYALCTLRSLPDPWDTKFEEVCTRVGIPYMRTNHQLSRDKYEDAVAGCRFIVNHFYEASTGGLTLMEAYRLGKPVLCSDSEWNGARDYFGDRAYYFKHGDELNFEQNLILMPARSFSLPAPDCKEWVESHFSDVVMVEHMLRRVYANTGSAA